MVLKIADRDLGYRLATLGSGLGTRLPVWSLGCQPGPESCVSAGVLGTNPGCCLSKSLDFA